MTCMTPSSYYEFHRGDAPEMMGLPIGKGGDSTSEVRVKVKGFGFERHPQIRAFRIIALLALMSCPVVGAYACNAPVGRFCVDFFKGRNLEGNPVVSRTVPYIKYNWASRSPMRTLPYDDFSARWQGYFPFEEGTYEFRGVADEGIRIKIDGRMVLDLWEGASGKKGAVTVTLGKGNHLVEVEYFEATGMANLEVAWKAVPTATGNGGDKASQGGPLPSVQVTQNTPAKPPIGINLSSFSYWSPAVPFKDLMMQSGLVGVYKRGTNEPCPEQPTLDEEGYPKILPKGCIFRVWSVFHILGDDFWPTGTSPYRPGRYVLLYEGNGKLTVGWDARNALQKNQGRIEFDVPSPKDGIQIEVVQSDPTNPVRALHLVHINDETTFRQQPFNEAWLDLLKPFKVIRFVDWGQINHKIQAYSGTAVAHTEWSITLPSSAPSDSRAFQHMLALVNVDDQWPRIFVDHYDGSTRTLFLKTPIARSKKGKQPSVTLFDFANRTWEARTQPTTLGQGSDRGVAFETMLQLANTLNASPWINIPTAADDGFVQQLASLIKTRLKPELKCYIEYSNETWNTAFPGYDYAEAKARELELTGTSPEADAWHAYRAVEIFKIFNRVFGEPDLREARKQSRLVRVLTSQTAWLDRARRVMDWRMPGGAWPTRGIPAYRFADAWAITTYFYLKGNKTLEQSNLDELIDMQIEDIRSQFGTATKPGLIRQILAEAQARGLQLIAYEGGTHLVAPHNRPDLVAKAALSNQSPRMREPYTELLKKWTELYRDYGAQSIGILNFYNDVGRYGQYGYWGLLQSTYQNRATTPKYQAIQSYISGQP